MLLKSRDSRFFSSKKRKSPIYVVYIIVAVIKVQILNAIDNCINNVYTTHNREVNKMETKIQKWGNSDGIRIPKNYLKSLNLKTNDLVDIKLEEDKIVIEKPKKKHLTLEERIAAYDGPNLCKEFEWDEPRGREIW